MGPDTDSALTTDRPPAVFPVRVGEYLCSRRELYCVEHIGHDRAVLEDCRSGSLIDVPRSELALLHRVRPR
jgi:hypothetical protein